MSIGNLKEQQRLRDKYPTLLKYYSVLEQTLDKCFERDLGPASKIDRVVFGLGIICAEDFQQAFVLCANGFGIGALQIVRGMYERQVTAAYLAKFPDEVDKFLAYHHVHRHKDLIHLKEMYGQERVNEMVPPARQAEIQGSYESVRDDFMTTKCEVCKTKRPMLSWTKYDTGILAKKGDQDLAASYYVNYYRPTLLSHSTVTSLMARLIDEGRGNLAFDVEGQRKHVTEALLCAHTLVINVVDLQNKHFKLGMNDEVEARFTEYIECWDHLRRTDRR
jgi:Family of unknown function (DUF5677)